MNLPSYWSLYQPIEISDRQCPLYNIELFLPLQFTGWEPSLIMKSLWFTSASWHHWASFWCEQPSGDGRYVFWYHYQEKHAGVAVNVKCIGFFQCIVQIKCLFKLGMHRCEIQVVVILVGNCMRGMIVIFGCAKLSVIDQATAFCNRKEETVKLRIPPFSEILHRGSLILLLY